MSMRNPSYLRSVPGSSEGAVVDTKSGGTDGGNGGMDDVLKRLGNVESNVSDIRTKVSAIEATVPHLATKADLNGVHGSLQTQITRTELAIIKWLVGTAIGIGALAFAIARYIAPA